MKKLAGHGVGMVSLTNHCPLSFSSGNTQNLRAPFLKHQATM
ncbi:MAG: hypothetical protein QM764_07800 [Chitinophagaceae bacterium]